MNDEINFEAAWAKDGPTRPWHRQTQRVDGRVSTESSPAFAAFRIYCELGDERSHVRVAEQCGKNVGLIARWSRRWKWVERVRALEDYLDELRLKAIFRERTKMAQRQARAAEFGQALAVTAMQALLQDLERAKLEAAKGKPVPSPISADEAARLFDVCSKVERICLGEPEDDAVATIVVNVQQRQVSRAEEMKALPVSSEIRKTSEMN